MERFDSIGYAIFVEVCSSDNADAPGTSKNRTMVNVELQTREADSDDVRKRNFRMTVEEFYDFTVRMRKMINDANNRL